MSSMKIIRRILDPITFVERVGIEFIPRLEDSVLDDQLAGSMSYVAPKNLPLPPSPPPPPDVCRPPTPPKHREKGASPNSSRNVRINPSAQGKLQMISPSPTTRSPGITLISPRGRQKSSLAALAEIGEINEMSEGSLADMSALQTSLHQHNAKEDNSNMVKCVRFADENETKEISRLRNSVIDEMFWASEDLANFRYEAFMEEAGLDIEEYD